MSALLNFTPTLAPRSIGAPPDRSTCLRLPHRLGARLKPSGKFHIGACPIGHASRDGFIVNPGKQLFYCRPAEAGGDAIEMVRHVQGCTKVEALAFITGDMGLMRAERAPAPIVVMERPTEPPRDPMRPWRNAGPLACDCVGDLYFQRRRRIRLTDAERACLRFSHAERHWPSQTRWPCVLACVALATGQEIGCHMTFVTPEDKAPLGDKARLFTTGSRSVGGGVWFGAPSPTEEFGAAEGIENLFSLNRIFGLTAGVAALSANGLRVLILPERVRRIRVFADNDAAGQGLSAARDAARRWIAEGREVALSMAEELGADASDVWLKRQRP